MPWRLLLLLQLERRERMDVDMADAHKRPDERQRRAVEALGLSDRDREGDDALLTQDSLEAFQKAAIYRALVDYKRRLSEALEDKEAKEKQLSLAKEREAALVGLWDGLLESWERLEEGQEKRTSLSDTVFAPNALHSSKMDIRASLKEIETNATGHLSGLIQRYQDQTPAKDGQNNSQLLLSKALQDSASLVAALAQTRQETADLKEKVVLASEQRHAMARKLDRMEMMMRDLKQKAEGVSQGGDSMEGTSAPPGMSRAPSESAAKIPDEQWKRAQGELAEARLLCEKREETISDLEKDLRKARDEIEQLRIQVVLSLVERIRDADTQISTRLSCDQMMLNCYQH